MSDKPIRPSHSFTVGRWFVPILVAVGVVALVGTGGVVWFGARNPNVYKELGTWGDFTGGLMNPILTSLTFIGVLFTIALQRQELALTREEVARSADALEAQQKSLQFQSFESTFFEMLKLHNDIVSSIDLYDYNTSRTTKGRDCFDVFFVRLARRFEQRGDLQQAYAGFWGPAPRRVGALFPISI